MSKRFRVALSFAGDRRDFVAEVARILAESLGQEHILYDRFHEAEFARPDLAVHLPKLYHDQSDLIVTVLSQSYLEKNWTGIEWKAVYAIINDKKRQPNEVMLTRFDFVEPEELFGHGGFVDLDGRAPSDCAALIIKRLAANDGLAAERAAAAAAAAAFAAGGGGSADWPEVAPRLDWPVADHTEARRAFGQLITRGAPFRLLLVHGTSETGKSHLSKQFFTNAFKITTLTCGRFDFKGSSNMKVELHSFAQILGVPLPSQDTVSGQLAEIYASLQRQGKPTLLIFDTFELAGDAERWVRDGLLLSIMRAPWLRVIVIGQKTINPHGEPWAGLTSKPIELRPPSPQEWFDYGREFRPNLTLDFVNQAHEMSGGKSALLAQLLGPSA